ncbi:hypothetical protein KBY86_00420 [Synechococcus sp. Lug-A]|uniref:hypothetical protein n=1 Tax=Synechococcus sp. Lug-A TaxID=2823740 RepID=UPI0020CF344B|nr:hypothetical protein [Synechococcus sp. Lug-A]MCP9845363.1 hypothetical protein [Synechococcus sp. Lug-A]
MFVLRFVVGVVGVFALVAFVAVWTALRRLAEAAVLLLVDRPGKSNADADAAAEALVGGVLVGGALMGGALVGGTRVGATLSGVVERWAASGEQVMNREAEMRRKL